MTREIRHGIFAIVPQSLKGEEAHGGRRGHRIRRAIGLALLLLLVFGFSIPAGVAADLEEQTRQIAAELRCPVCQNLSVADSPSELAQQMRALIAQQLKEGKTPEQVKAFFVSKYGEWVLLAPEPKGFSLLLWVFPYAAALTGIVLVILTARRWVHRGKNAQKATVDPGLVARVRQEEKEPAFKQTAAAADTPQALLQQERARIYSYLRELEFDYEAGKFSQADYQNLRRDYEAQAAVALKESDSLPQPQEHAPPERPRAKKTQTGAAQAAAVGFWRRGWVLAFGGAFILLFGITLGLLLSTSLRPRQSEGDSITGDFLTGTG
ncbi:MAG: cytochrome c-type biogenesis protein, partial [Candidatus Binatia bacterium]